MNRIRCPLRLLLTGTPLQNNLHELWALLNYILPELFATSSVFDEAVHIANNTFDTTTCNQARDLLDQFMMLRRVKKDVESSLLPKRHVDFYVSMTELQRRWYKSIICQQQQNSNKSNSNKSNSNNDNDDLNDSELVASLSASSSASSASSSDSSVAALSMLTMHQLAHTLSQLTKVCNHPKQILLKRQLDREAERKRVDNAAYAGAQFIKPRTDLLEPEPHTKEYEIEAELRELVEEKLIQSSAKLALLDRLLLRLKSQGSRVLLFSQWAETLDILEEYLKYRFGQKGQAYLRLDGQTNRILRELDVRTFNALESPVFLYLISTKAGGMGINLATADSVVLYDSCINPMVDLQAQVSSSV